MPRTFDGTNDQITLGIGALTGFAYGTLACIFKRSTDASWDALIVLHASGGAGSSRSSIEISDGNRMTWQVGALARNSTFDVLVADGWQLLACTKTTGSTTPRFHRYVYSTGTWTHTDATTGSAADNSTPGGSGRVVLGEWEGDDDLGGDLAVAGAWSNRALSDAEVEHLAFSLAAWHSTAPTALWVLDQSATSQAVIDLTGNGSNQTSITGTAVATASLPVFSYGHDVLTPHGHAASGATVTGTANAALGALTGTATGTPSVPGTMAATLGALAATAAAVRTVLGSAVTALGRAVGTIAGVRTTSGTAASSLGALAATATGEPSVPGTAAAQLGALAASATAVRTVVATASSSLGAAAGTATGTRTTTGTGSAALGALSATATGEPSVPGTAQATLGGLTGSATGLRTVTGTAQSSLGPLAADVSIGAATVTGSAAAQLGALAGSASGTRTVPAIAAAGLGSLDGSAAGKRTILAGAAATLGVLVASGQGKRTVTALGTGALGSVNASALGARTTSGTALADLGRLVAGATVAFADIPGNPVASSSVASLVTGRGTARLTATHASGLEATHA